MGALWTDIPELLDQHLAGIQDRVDQAQAGPWLASPTAAAPDTVCTRHDGYTRTVGQLTNMLPGDLELVLHAHSDLRWSLGLIAKLRARVAELEGAVEGAHGLAVRLDEFAENALRVDDRELYTAIASDLRARLARASQNEAAELAEGMAGLDAMRADHPAPCRVPDSPDCTCPDGEAPLEEDELRASLRGHLFGGVRTLDQR